MSKKNGEKQINKELTKYADKEMKSGIKKDADGKNDLISANAYALFEKSGFAHGNDRAHWLEAEKMVTGNK